MSEVVYYDENPTVRNLMVKTLSRFGCEVILMPSLNQCEETLRNCKNPIVLIVDLSRYPEKLPRLQAIVPNYISNPDQCILTSTRLNSLARYLPEQIDDCFFKHVVERPFKRLDFAQFVENIILPYLPNKTEHAPSISIPMLNSNVSQITGQVTQGPFDEELKKQVESIISSSRSIPLHQLEAMAAVDSVAKNIKSNRSESLLKSLPKGVDAKIGENQPVSPAVFHDETRDFPADGHIPGLKESVVSSPSHVSLIRHLPQSTIIMGLVTFLAILKMTAIHNSRLTLVCRDTTLTDVIIVEAGRVQWIETLQYETVPDENYFFMNTPYASSILPVQEIIGLMRQNISMSAAISALHAEERSIEVCEKKVREAISRIYALEGRMVDVYRDVPPPWDVLMQKRPIQGIDVVPMLFNLCRKNEDSVIVPEIFRFANFAMRPYRTPLNRTIELTKEESDLIIYLQSPRTISDLKRTRTKGAADLLYRLVIFEFVDLVG